MTAQFRLGLATFGYRGGSQKNNYILQDLEANLQEQIVYANLQANELSVRIDDSEELTVRFDTDEFSATTVQGVY